MATKSLGEFVKPSDSISMTNIDGQPFTIAASEDSDFTNEDGSVSKGKKITTVETFQIDGKDWNKFHTTRKTIVDTLNKPAIIESLKKGDKIGPMKTIKQSPKGKGRNDYWVLVPA